MDELYEKLLENIPDYSEFLTVDEMDASSKKLAETFPEAVSIKEIGRTREDHPLYCLRIGDGALNALLFGLPHPNEPIGTMMLEYLTWELAKNKELRDRLGYTFYVVKAWDADGAKKNEGWFKGPFTVTNYMRNFFRPAGFEQVDWTFPIEYKLLHFRDSIPETVAMMKLIDEIRPRFIYSLHNAGFGGVYWYMSAPTPEIFDALHAVPDKYGVPMHKGEPETPSCTELSQSIYASLGMASEYDYLEQYGGKPMSELVGMFKCGDCSAAYAAERWGSFTFLTELPYFYDPRIDDSSDSDMLRKDAVRQKTGAGLELHKELTALKETCDSVLDPKNHYLLAVQSFSENAEENAEAVYRLIESKPEYNRPATKAEVFDNLLISRFYQVLSFALLMRACESELLQTDDPGRRAGLEKAFGETKAAFEKHVAELEEDLNYEVVPIRNLIGIQLESGLLMADYLREHPDVKGKQG